MEVSLSEMVKIVADTLHPEPYSKEEVCKVLGVTEEEPVSYTHLTLPTNAEV